MGSPQLTLEGVGDALRACSDLLDLWCRHRRRAQVFVANLPHETTEEQIREFVAGAVTGLQVRWHGRRE
jgi:hypothetical protein